VVARAFVGNGTALITSDIGQSTEIQIARLSSIRCDVLVIPHHGSRNSTSTLLLNRAKPLIALVPAASGNTHGHPHPEALQRLDSREIVTRWPARDGECGARWTGTRWEAYP
jgi:competence protein ComEC